MKNIYKSGDYLSTHPDWHRDDSPWKAAQILRMIEKHKLSPPTLCEVGCGAGEILNCLSMKMENTQFYGYEVSPQAIALCNEIENKKINFIYGDILETEEKYNMLLCIDVFEHIPNYFDFLGNLRKHSEHFIFHIPLDLSLLTIIRPQRLLKSRYRLGHIHLFTYELALAALQDCGYQVIDSFFTARGLERPKNDNKLGSKLMNIPRRIIGSLNKRTAAKLFGGYSLLVLAKPNPGISSN